MSHQRKIVLIGPAYPLRGGLATYNERLVREFISRGDDARIETFSLQYPSILFPGKTQFSTEPAPPDLPIRISVNSINPLNWIRVGNRIRKMRPDLVIVKFWMPFMAPCFGTICRIIKKNGHTRVISIIDNIIPHEKRPGDRALAKYWTSVADGFIAMSRSVMNDLGTFFNPALPKPVLFSPHPLYDTFGKIIPAGDARVRLKLDPEKKYILFFGFIRDYKGLDLLLKAFADPRLRKLPVKLLVAGEFYTDSKPYFEMVEQLGLTDHVVMSNDFIPDSEVQYYFSAANLVVQPYKSATQSGVSQIAYHFNKPMIITDVGGLAEIVPDGKVGYVVNPDERQVSDAILRFFEENKEEEFSKNASVEKQKYSWSRMLDDIDHLIEEINKQRR